MPVPLPIRCWFLPCLLAAAPLGQDALGIEASLENLYLERRLAFEEAWLTAADEARARALAELRAIAEQGGAEGGAFSARALTEARAALAGAGAAERSLAARVAESLDLRVLPGAFGARRTGDGEEVVVRVLPAYTEAFARALPEELTLALVWIAPDGREVRALEEPVHRAALTLPGFELYFRAPASEPGVWRLVPEVRLEGGTGRGIGVEVECLRDLFPRYRALASAPIAGERERRHLERLERALLRGLRDARGPSIGELLEGAQAVPAAFGACPELPEDERTLEIARAPAPARECVVLLAPELEDPSWSLLGHAGAAWAQLVAEHGARVIVTARPLHDARGADLLGLLGRLKENDPKPRTTLVLGEGPAERLRSSWHEASALCDRVVIESQAGKRPLAPRFPVPTLWLVALAQEAAGGPALESDCLLLRSEEPAILARAGLGPALADWWRSLEREGGGER